MDEFIKFLKNNNIIAILSNEVSNINEKTSILRANINKVNKVDNFIMLYQEFSKTLWIRVGQLDNPSRVMFHKYWVCHYSKVNKVKYSLLCAKISMNECHNHSVNTNGSMKFLRITPENCGIFTQKMAKKNFGCVNNPLEKLKEKTQSHTEKGISIIIHEEKPWAVLVVTPLMKRVQHLSSSKELIFCDSTSSCDTMETTLTTVLAVSNTGAVPIAMIMHEGQSSDSYTNAFRLLEKHYPLCFGCNESLLNGTGRLTSIRRSKEREGIK
ncbi:hypothetical protein QTP88_026461 [Uroleucon formosanum]